MARTEPDGWRPNPGRDRDSTRRLVDRRIASIALPVAAALATEPLFEVCDTAIIGHLGSEELGGASLAIRLLGFGYGVFVFLMFGTTAAVARRVGAGDRRGAAAEAVSALWIAVAIGVVATAALVATGRTLLETFGARDEVADHAWTWLSVNAFGIVGYTVTMVGVGVRRGFLDTRTPLVVAAVSSLANLVADLVLVVGLGLGLVAAATTTTVAKLAGAAWYARSIARTARTEGVALRPQRGRMRSQLGVGADLVVRTLLLRGVIVAAQSLAAHRGATQLAAFAIGFQIWMFAAYATDGLEAAGQSLVSHHLGATERDRTGRAAERGADASASLGLVVVRLCWWGSWLGLGLGGALALASGILPRAFTADEAVVAAAATSLRWVAAFSVVATLAFVSDGILVGAGRQRWLGGSMVAATAAFALVAVIGSSDDGLGVVWAAIAALMIVRLLAGAWAIRDLVRDHGS